MAICNHQADNPLSLWLDVWSGNLQTERVCPSWDQVSLTTHKLKPLSHLVFETVSIRFWSLPNLILIFACLVAISCLTRFFDHPLTSSMSPYFFTLGLNEPIWSRMSSQVVPSPGSVHIIDQTHYQHCHNNLTPIRLNPCYLVTSKLFKPNSDRFSWVLSLFWYYIHDFHCITSLFVYICCPALHNHQLCTHILLEQSILLQPLLWMHHLEKASTFKNNAG